MSNTLAASRELSSPSGDKAVSRAELYRRMAPFAKANSFLGYKSFVTDLLIYSAGLSAVLFFDSIWLKIVGGLVAGSGLVNLGSLSHEAAHRSMVKSRLGNKVIAVVTLTMLLFNYRLWIYDHHVLHHGRTNVKHNNFLSPLTLEEFRALPPLRRALYRAYHSPLVLGIPLYFMLERWPTVHYFPGKWLPAKFRKSALGYTALITAWLAALLSALVLVPSARGESVAVALLLGFVVPYMIWFTVFSMTAFLQHTNPRLRWYRDVSSMATPPESLSVQVGFPALLNHITHYVLEHPVHHLHAMVPHYRLKEAQAVLGGLVGPAVITMQFNLPNTLDVLRRCRLYDYELHAWTDFEGNVTALVPNPSPSRATAADRFDDAALAPYAGDDGSPPVFFPDAAGTPAPARAEERVGDA